MTYFLLLYQSFFFLFILFNEFKNNLTKSLNVIKNKVINDVINQTGADASDKYVNSVALPLARDKKLDLYQEIQKHLHIY